MDKEKSTSIMEKMGIMTAQQTREQVVRSYNLPEIVVDHCATIREQESTESAKSSVSGSSVHNSLDDCQDPASGSSSRSESPTLSDKSSVICASLQVIGECTNLTFIHLQGVYYIGC